MSYPILAMLGLGPSWAIAELVCELFALTSHLTISYNYIIITTVHDEGVSTILSLWCSLLLRGTGVV